MRLQNLNEIRDKIFCEIKELVSELSCIKSAEELGDNCKKVRILYEKAIFLEKLYKEGILSKQQEDSENSLSGWKSFSNISININDYDEVVVEKTEVEALDIPDLVVGKTDESNIKTKIINKIDEVDFEQKIKLKSIKNVEPVSLDQNVKNDTNTDNKKNIFNLDLNDRITFLKMLFSGDEVEMTVTLDKLYNSKTLLEANEYLSEIYHERNWSSVDEYAQRLWALVERKF